MEKFKFVSMDGVDYKYLRSVCFNLICRELKRLMEADISSEFKDDYYVFYFGINVWNKFSHIDPNFFRDKIHKMHGILVACDIYMNNNLIELRKRVPYYYITTYRPHLNNLITTLNRCDDILEKIYAQDTWEKEGEKIMLPENINHYNVFINTDYPEIKKVIFNNPATIVLWNDGTKTIVKCGKDDIYDPEKGLAMAVAKKFLGTNKSKSNYCDIFKKWIPKDVGDNSISTLERFEKIIRLEPSDE